VETGKKGKLFLKIHLGHDLGHLWIFKLRTGNGYLLGSCLVACSSLVLMLEDENQDPVSLSVEKSTGFPLNLWPKKVTHNILSKSQRSGRCGGVLRKKRPKTVVDCTFCRVQSTQAFSVRPALFKITLPQYLSTDP